MFNQSRSKMFVVLMFAILSMSAISIYYVAPQATEMLNGTSIDTQQIGGSAIVSRDDNVKEIIPSQSQEEAAQLSRPFATQSRLPDLAPTLVESSTNVFLLPDLAPTLVKSPSDDYGLPDLAPTIVKSQDTLDLLPDLAPTLP